MPVASQNGRFVTDDAGNRIAAIVDINQYRQLLEAAEELEDIRAFDEAKDADDEVIPFETAIREIEQARL